MRYSTMTLCLVFLIQAIFSAASLAIQKYRQQLSYEMTLDVPLENITAPCCTSWLLIAPKTKKAYALQILAGASLLLAIGWVLAFGWICVQFPFDLWLCYPLSIGLGGGFSNLCCIGVLSNWWPNKIKPAIVICLIFSCLSAILTIPLMLAMIMEL